MFFVLVQNRLYFHANFDVYISFTPALQHILQVKDKYLTPIAEMHEYLDSQENMTNEERINYQFPHGKILTKRSYYQKFSNPIISSCNL